MTKRPDHNLIEAVKQLQQLQKAARDPDTFIGHMVRQWAHEEKARRRDEDQDFESSTHQGDTEIMRNRVWLASHFNDTYGVSTQAFSTEEKAWEWKAELEDEWGEFDEDNTDRRSFTIQWVRIDSDDCINAG